jgi:hypothetical protein
MMRASVGDRIVIKSHGVGEPDRDAEILEVHGLDGAPPYVVRWADDGHEGLFFPGADASVQHFPQGDTAAEPAGPADDHEVQELSLEECLALLAAHRVGRIAVLKEGTPVIVPVNYRLVQVVGLTWIAFRTRLGGLLERAPLHVGFEIDAVDDEAQTGWSVFVRGTLHHVDADAADFRGRFDSEPWLADRDAWMLIEPFRIEGRRLEARLP